MPEILSLVDLKLEDGLNSDAEDAQISNVIEGNIEKVAEAEDCRPAGFPPP